MIERVSYEEFNDTYRVMPSITEETIETPLGQIIDGVSVDNLDAVIRHDEEHPNTVWSIIAAEVIDPVVYDDDEDYEESHDPINDDSDEEGDENTEEDDEDLSSVEEYHIVPGIEEIHAIGYIITELPYDDDVIHKCYVLDI